MKGNVDNIGRQMTYLIIAAACHALWHKRNDRLHNQGHRLPAGILIQKIHRVIRKKINSCTEMLKKYGNKNKTASMIL